MLTQHVYLNNDLAYLVPFVKIVGSITIPILDFMICYETKRRTLASILSTYARGLFSPLKPSRKELLATVFRGDMLAVFKFQQFLDTMEDRHVALSLKAFLQDYLKNTLATRVFHDSPSTYGDVVFKVLLEPYCAFFEHEGGVDPITKKCVEQVSAQWIKVLLEYGNLDELRKWIILYNLTDEWTLK